MVKVRLNLSSVFLKLIIVFSFTGKFLLNIRITTNNYIMIQVMYVYVLCPYVSGMNFYKTEIRIYICTSITT